MLATHGNWQGEGRVLAWHAGSPGNQVLTWCDLFLIRRKISVAS
jgi:hypothetical protein